MPQKLVSDAGSNLSTGFSLIRDSLNSIDVKDFLKQTGVQYCELEQYPKGSLNRGIGGIIESGVALIRKLIQGAIRNNVLDFQQFSHVIKQCVCYANKRPLYRQEALRECNPDDQFQVLTPEFLKFGYENAILEVGDFSNDDSEVWEPAAVVDFVDFRKLKETKDRLRQHYHSEFLYGLIDQATKLKNKYLPVHHENVGVGDIVLIKDSFVKAPNYPLAKIVSVVRNSIGEVTQAILLKGNKSIVKRDTSSIIPLVKSEQPGEVSEDVGHLENPSIVRSCGRPIRQAALDSRAKTREMIEEASV